MTGPLRYRACRTPPAAAAGGSPRPEPFPALGGRSSPRFDGLLASGRSGECGRRPRLPLVDLVDGGVPVVHADRVFGPEAGHVGGVRVATYFHQAPIEFSIRVEGSD